GLRLRGARRPLRFHPADLQLEPGNDEHGPYVECRFELPPGSYATVLLREVCKRGLEESLSFEGRTD
ncbi:MAG: tRNA pseudouridine(13) synthase TruD, partial [Planctomycetota bacterium]|nr:tRNA pseudouridine(13) synthase TruD [Planctomycetota bacterium]